MYYSSLLYITIIYEYLKDVYHWSMIFVKEMPDLFRIFLNTPPAVSFLISKAHISFPHHEILSEASGPRYDS